MKIRFFRTNYLQTIFNCYFLKNVLCKYVIIATLYKNQKLCDINLPEATLEEYPQFE